MKVLKGVFRLSFMFLLIVCIGCCVSSKDVHAGVKVPKSAIGYMKPSLMLGNKSTGHVKLHISGLKGASDLTVVKMVPSNFVRYYGTFNYLPVFESTKPTSGTVYYKLKGSSKTYKTKITIKKYVNPVKSVSITGLKNGGSKNLASMTNNTCDTKEIKLSRVINNAKVSVTAKSGWKVSCISDGVDSIDYDKPVSKVSDKIHRKLDGKHKRAYSIYIELINSRNSAEIILTYNINTDPRNIPQNIEMTK